MIKTLFTAKEAYLLSKQNCFVLNPGVGKADDADMNSDEVEGPKKNEKWWNSLQSEKDLRLIDGLWADMKYQDIAQENNNEPNTFGEVQHKGNISVNRTGHSSMNSGQYEMYLRNCIEDNAEEDWSDRSFSDKHSDDNKSSNDKSYTSQEVNEGLTTATPLKAITERFPRNQDGQLFIDQSSVDGSN